jgi:hypothetical protein
MPYLPILQAGDIPLQIKAVKLLVFLLGDKIGNNLKGRNSPGISPPCIGRGACLLIITVGHIILNVIIPQINQQET